MGFTEKELIHLKSVCLYKEFDDPLFFLQTWINGDFMSTNVDWERADLFHLSMDNISHYVSTHLSTFIIRNDYGLYEYTLYIYKSSFPIFHINLNLNLTACSTLIIKTLIE